MAKQKTEEKKSPKLIFLEEIMKKVLNLQELTLGYITPYFWNYDEVHFYEVIRQKRRICLGIHVRKNGGSHILCVLRSIKAIKHDLERNDGEGKKLYPDMVIAFKENPKDHTYDIRIRGEETPYVNPLKFPPNFHDVYYSLCSYSTNETREHNIKIKKTNRRK